MDPVRVSAFRSSLAALGQEFDTLVASDAPAPFYDAPTHRNVALRPPRLPLGPAGSVFTDPMFGSRIVRVTDEFTAEASSACRPPSNEAVSPWRCDSGGFYVVDRWGNPLVFDLVDGLPVRRVLEHLRGSTVEPSFSFTNPDHLWIVAGPHLRTVQRFSLGQDRVVGDVIDLDLAYPSLDLTDTYTGGLHLADGDAWVVFFGGKGQDAHHYVHHSAAGLIDTLKLPRPFYIHAAGLDRSGRRVVLYPTAGQPVPVVVFDTHTGEFTDVTRIPGGHWALGAGEAVNADCCSQGAWDSLQWQLRDLATPDQTRDLVSTITPHVKGRSDHTNWRAATAGQHVPIVSATFVNFAGLTPEELAAALPLRPWDGELLAIATDGSDVVWRFCHHNSVFEGEFWDQPLIAVSPDAAWAIVGTNWGRTVGVGRQDVLLIALKGPR